mmetsp:Transcript_34596/g.73876  ORF Transcript_34596/g.73876 Transcript_34596/m.73876 type:complete len:203 (+) Transcript_34596:117-725(+)|eukprot:CAMPEP_0183343884 /NCGR_PEP_ID=MMETSP0164_2-20130417/9703_1 /TAXON_ID=221442 /ORGANISM="Coccolithus pelagicus ssp braarudi, Strain PLY182g" /LENGTH=202 /DNA_ID=CAMNT_0025514803 /DNA_START=117 /DNA_END=725 /DNA_ORIENTATION=-
MPVSVINAAIMTMAVVDATANVAHIEGHKRECDNDADVGCLAPNFAGGQGKAARVSTERARQRAGARATEELQPSTLEHHPVVQGSPRQKLYELLAPPALLKAPFGVCGTAKYGQSCTKSSRGAWPLPANATGSWAAALFQCTHMCKGCANCHYISFSNRNRDCSWFNSCRINELQQSVSGFRSLDMAVMQTEWQPQPGVLG